jgi:hypothetical protein
MEKTTTNTNLTFAYVDSSLRTAKGQLADDAYDKTIKGLQKKNAYAGLWSYDEVRDEALGVAIKDGYIIATADHKGPLTQEEKQAVIAKAEAVLAEQEAKKNNTELASLTVQKNALIVAINGEAVIITPKDGSWTGKDAYSHLKLAGFDMDDDNIYSEHIVPSIAVSEDVESAMYFRWTKDGATVEAWMPDSLFNRIFND